VRTFFASPSRRRRFAFSTGTFAVLVPLVYLAVHFSSPGSPRNAEGPNVDESALLRVPKKDPFTAPERRAVHELLRRFIATAVARHDVAASWRLTGPALRSGFTRKQWATGEISVVPFPASGDRQGTWDRVLYSYRNAVGLEVLVFPRRCSGFSVATGDVEVVRGHDGRWRVNYWMVTKFHGPGSVGPVDSPSKLLEGPPNVHKLPGRKPGCR
jgi:hypothetical protein